MRTGTTARRLLAASTVIALALLGAVGTSIGESRPAQASSIGIPGVPNPVMTLFTGDFENVSTNTAEDFRSYSGSLGATPTGMPGMTYSSSPQWTAAAGACDGWVTSSTAVAPADPGCTPAAWLTAREMAKALGQAQGMSNPATNHALVALTSTVPPTTSGFAGTMMQTSFGIPAVAGHYYGVSASFAEASCDLGLDGNASLTFYLIENGNPIALQSGLSPCDVGTLYEEGPATTDDIRVARLIADSQQLPTLPAGSPPTALGFRLDNDTDTGVGNDVAIDLVQIQDTTPQLYLDLASDTIDVDGVTTLTYTITNAGVEALRAKPGWSFANALPAGLSAVGAPVVSGGACDNVSATVTDGVVRVSGDLGDGELDGVSSCSVSLPVSASVGGDYTDGAASFPDSAATATCAGGPGIGLCGLWAPDAVTLHVLPVLSPDQATVPHEGRVTIPVLDNDQGVPSGSTVTEVAGDDTSQGTWTINDDGTVTFTAAPDFVGTARATYTVTYPDGTTGWSAITVTVAPSSAAAIPPSGSAAPGTDEPTSAVLAGGGPSDPLAQSTTARSGGSVLASTGSDAVAAAAAAAAVLLAGVVAVTTVHLRRRRQAR